MSCGARPLSLCDLIRDAPLGQRAINRPRVGLTVYLDSFAGERGPLARIGDQEFRTKRPVDDEEFSQYGSLAIDCRRQTLIDDEAQ